MEPNYLSNQVSLLPPADLAAEIQKLEEEIISERDRNLRTLADFTNYKRHIERDGNKLSEEGKREIMLPLLDIIEDMERALQNASTEENSIVIGVKIIQKKLLALLEMQGVIPFESVGRLYDHNLHEAVGIVKHEGSEPGIVINELHKGYLWNNELLCASQVQIAE